jgi:hypothetical protein
MKNDVFWDVAPCRSCVNRRFGGTYCLHLQVRKTHERRANVSRWLADCHVRKTEGRMCSSACVLHTRTILLLYKLRNTFYIQILKLIIVNHILRSTIVKLIYFCHASENGPKGSKCVRPYIHFDFNLLNLFHCTTYYSNKQNPCFCLYRRKSVILLT